MDIRRRPPKPPLRTTPLHPHSASGAVAHSKSSGAPTSPRASDALPLPLLLTNGIFFTLFFSVAYFLLHRWREKIRNSVPLHVLTLSELAALLSLIASFIYLLGFFGIDFVQSFISKSDGDMDEDRSIHCSMPSPIVAKPEKSDLPEDEEDIINRVVSGEIPSYSLESKLGDCFMAAKIRREALQRQTGRSVEGLALEGFDYDSILGQCCEMAVGYVQIPVGIAGTLLLNGREYLVPMATTEGCLVASTNRGCKAIYGSGGSACVLLRGGMTRAPVGEEGIGVEVLLGGAS